jgi:hypothetical protein
MLVDRTGMWSGKSRFVFWGPGQASRAASSPVERRNGLMKVTLPKVRLCWKSSVKSIVQPERSAIAQSMASQGGGADDGRRGRV